MTDLKNVKEHPIQYKGWFGVESPSKPLLKITDIMRCFKSSQKLIQILASLDNNLCYSQSFRIHSKLGSRSSDKQLKYQSFLEANSGYSWGSFEFNKKAGEFWWKRFDVSAASWMGSGFHLFWWLLTIRSIRRAIIVWKVTWEGGRGSMQEHAGVLADY